MNSLGVYITVALCLVVFLSSSSFANTSHFDKQQFVEAVVSKIESELVEQLETQVKDVEANFIKDTYIKEMLEPYAEFGIDSDDVKIYESINAIYSSIINDPEYDPKAEMKAKIQDLIKTRVINLIKPDIDNESLEIASQLNNLLLDANDKIKDITDAYENIAKIPKSADDYETQVTEVIRNIGFKGPITDVIEDLEVVFGATYDKYADPLQILATITYGISSDNPTDKIEILFSLGSDLGSRLPMVGSIVSGLFDVGKELLAATKRTGGLLENNYGQGCIARTGEYNQEDPLKQQFYQQFPHINRACPLKLTGSSGVYHRIFFNEDNNRELIFLINGKWFGSSVDDTHVGEDDIKAMRIWLKQNNDKSKADNLMFLFESYRKRPGFKNYQTQVAEKLNQLVNLLRQVLVPLYACDDVGKTEFIMQQIGLSWFSKLMNAAGGFTYEDAKYFSPITIELIWNQMIKNRYISGHRINLEHLDKMIFQLKNNFPVLVNGIVSNNKTIKGAKISTTLPTLLAENDCVKTLSNQAGSYQLIMALPHDYNQTVDVVTAKYMDQNNTEQSKTIKRKIDLSRQKEYQINITFGDEASNEMIGFTIEPGAVQLRVGEKEYFTAVATYADGEKKDVTTSAMADSVFNAVNTGRFSLTAHYNDKTATANITVLPSINSSTNLNCDQYNDMQIQWNEITQSNECVCIDGSQWDEISSQCKATEVDWGALQSEVETTDTCEQPHVLQAFKQADDAIANEQMSEWANAIKIIRTADCINDRLRGSATTAINILSEKQRRQDKIADIVNSRPSDTTDYSQLINTLTELINLGNSNGTAPSSGLPTANSNTSTGRNNQSLCKSYADKIFANNKKLIAAANQNNQSEMQRLNEERNRLVRDSNNAGC